MAGCAQKSHTVGLGLRVGSFRFAGRGGVVRPVAWAADLSCFFRGDLRAWRGVGLLCQFSDRAPDPAETRENGRPAF